MYEAIYTVYLLLLSLTGDSGDGQANRYYSQITPGEFSNYIAKELSVKSKYGNVYKAHELEKSGFTLDFYVFEKIDGDKKTLFKMDELTQIKNDSTFMLCEPPMKMAGDTINWVNGLWFYSSTDGSGTTNFSVDSMPAKVPVMDYSKIEMGIYKCTDGKLVKLSDTQSGEAFSNLKESGFFFLPNPGFFYTLANFKDIK